MGAKKPAGSGLAGDGEIRSAEDSRRLKKSSSKRNGALILDLPVLSRQEGRLQQQSIFIVFREQHQMTVPTPPKRFSHNPDAPGSWWVIATNDLKS